MSIEFLSCFLRIYHGHLIKQITVIPQLLMVIQNATSSTMWPSQNYLKLQILLHSCAQTFKHHDGA